AAATGCAPVAGVCANEALKAHITAKIASSERIFIRKSCSVKSLNLSKIAISCQLQFLQFLQLRKFI
ncbi:MAG: hypothetical protein WCH35_18110, partial [Comamonadaceae bacterium]